MTDLLSDKVRRFVTREKLPSSFCVAFRLIYSHVIRIKKVRLCSESDRINTQMMYVMMMMMATHASQLIRTRKMVSSQRYSLEFHDIFWRCGDLTPLGVMNFFYLEMNQPRKVYVYLVVDIYLRGSWKVS